MPFCENLRSLKEKAGESNYQLAKSIGVSQVSVGNWVSGKRKPLPVYLKMIAEHYGVTVEQLIS